jgi:hypothetical protein
VTACRDSLCGGAALVARECGVLRHPVVTERGGRGQANDQPWETQVIEPTPRTGSTYTVEGALASGVRAAREVLAAAR